MEPTINRRELYDERFFYVDPEDIGHCTCGLARDMMATMIRNYQNSFFLSHHWLGRMRDFKDNPIVLGFYVEHACLSSISMQGLHVADLSLGKMRTVMFSGYYPNLDDNTESAFYIPRKFNFAAIDGLIVLRSSEMAEQKGNKRAKTDVKKEVHLIPIQITIGKHNSKSELKFFTQ